MRRIECRGSPYEIGVQHGTSATTEIKRGLEFYEKLFQETAKLSWEEVCQTASKFLPLLERDWPSYYEELNGLSHGSRIPFLSLLALNVRTELAYGLFNSDGCTALSLKTSSTTYLAQNWDWQHEQAQNLIILRLDQEPPKPLVEMVTEAGIIGKIGLNSAGVGVCLNAIRARGVDFQKLPCHLALRCCLDSGSREEAVKALKKAGVASACHILLADPGGGVGMECSHVDVLELLMSNGGVVTHTNHFVREHPGVEDTLALADSPARLDRINHLVDGLERRGQAGLGLQEVRDLLKDEDNYPASICRAQTESSTVATLFSITMDLGRRYADVKFGRPSEVTESIRLEAAERVQ